MTNYTDVIYPPDEQNTYPKRLAAHIGERFFKNCDIGSNPRILDIGCCTGKALKLFSNVKNLELCGIDVRDEGATGFEFKKCNLETDPIPYPDNHFDYIYSKSVLEHVFNTDNFLSEALRVLKPGGTVVFLTPDWVSCMDVFWDDYTHVRAFSRKSLRDALMITGFEGVDCEHFYQLPFTWKRPWLRFIPYIISFLPNFLKWKTREQRNTKDRKLIRFSKEKMLLVYGTKR
jgi:ubiquinone/menaquinone biosynthesis C-methylase UbiE